MCAQIQGKYLVERSFTILKFYIDCIFKKLTLLCIFLNIFFFLNFEQGFTELLSCPCWASTLDPRVMGLQTNATMFDSEALLK